MQIKCEYCDQYYDGALPKCPHCGSPNENLRRTANSVPRTIEELQAYCARMGFTPEKTRFFIGQDYRGAKAFGIYKDLSGKCVVYKNKADGSRAVRYEGYDEAYAVNELYSRLQSEIVNQKSHYVDRKARDVDQMRRQHFDEMERNIRQPRRSSGKTAKRALLILFIVTIIFSVSLPAILMLGRKIFSSTGSHYDNGYYSSDQGTYYSLDDDWYYYDDDYSYWVPMEGVPEEFGDDAEEYYYSPYFNPSVDGFDFEDTDYYSDWEYEQSQSSYDDDDGYTYDNDYDDDDYDWDDDDWGSDDWDFGDTDWDSDW